MENESKTNSMAFNNASCDLKPEIMAFNSSVGDNNVNYED